MAANNKMPGTAVDAGEARASRPEQLEESPLKDGHLAVSEIIADRAAAPSPFGDDQTFPLPVESLTYTPATTP